MSSVFESFTLLCFCCLGGLGIGTALYVLFRTLQATSAGSRLGRQMGLEKLVAEDGQSRGWWGGEYDGRRFGMRAMGQPTGASFSSGRRRYTMVFWLIMEVRLAKPTTISLESVNVGKGKGFYETFSTDDDLELPESSRQALLAFSEVGYGKRFTRSGRYLSANRNRAFSFGSREERSFNVPELLPDATAVLAVRHPEPNLKPGEVKELLADMSALAAVLEADLGG